MVILPGNMVYINPTCYRVIPWSSVVEKVTPYCKQTKIVLSELEQKNEAHWAVIHVLIDIIFVSMEGKVMF